jgi:hypothetical protein
MLHSLLIGVPDLAPMLHKTLYILFTKNKQQLDINEALLTITLTHCREDYYYKATTGTTCDAARSPQSSLTNQQPTSFTILIVP